MNMGIINQLDFKVANLIAAGEVVDRPASAVKELLENSIDAGAKSITVELKRGGVAFIRVTDDGCGMGEEDVPICIKRHATSKIKTSTDLNTITTLGFRGEALAAIAAVSRLRIMTRPRDSELGTIMEAVGGENVNITRGGCAIGTTVIIEELFANVPARRKFLKRDVSEGMACSAVVEKIALSHPEIAFKLITDGQLRYMTDGKGDLYATIHAVLGREFSSKLLRVDGLMMSISVYGFIGQPDNIRSNRNFQNFFINGRYVKSRTCMSALEQAYNSYIPSDKFPCCVLMLTIDPLLVDVNVHPTKLEVKFSDEKSVFDAIYCSVRNALEKAVSRPSMLIEPSSVSYDDLRLKNAFVPIYDRADTMLSQKPEQKLFFEEAGEEEPRPTLETKITLTEAQSEVTKAELPFVMSEAEAESDNGQSREMPVSNAFPDMEATAKQEEETDKTDKTERIVYSDTPTQRSIDVTNIPYYKIIGEAFNSYVMVELKDKMLMIDKHAAHERIIFESMKRNMQKGGVAQQMLMFPMNVLLTPEEQSAVSEHEKEIRAIGYDYSMSGNSLTVTAIPSQLDEAAAKELIEVLAQRLSQGMGDTTLTKNVFLERSLYQASCKAAIKAGRIEDSGHIKWICDNLLALPDIKFCPHGRPVAIELTKQQMEKSFKRT